jgi:succinyl-CoA synthetase alpha subunit
MVKPNLYSDSVSLMRLSNDVAALEGIQDVLVGMATDLNRELLANMGATTAETEAATPNDLLIAVIAVSEAAANNALAAIEEGMKKKKAAREETGNQVFELIDEVAELDEGFNIAVISAPGTYAAHECLTALSKGIHVFLFSDNVSIEEEVRLKELANSKGLLMMGPDCGTAIINGTALGFANVVRLGDVGIVAASGTGLQQVTQLIDAMGGGITQAIGVGGRDLSSKGGGRTMLAALDALRCDEATRVIVLLSKPPAPEVATKVLEAAKNIDKPVVLCLLGRELEADLGSIELAGNLEATAAAAVRLATGSSPVLSDPYYSEAPLAAALDALSTEQRYVRGIFCGGTVCDEAMVYFRSQGLPITSNIPLSDDERLANVHTSAGNTFIDMGDDYFTSGKPHPMIDPSLRNKRIVHDALLDDTAVMLIDVELGYGSHHDPAGVLVEAVHEANARLSVEGRSVLWIASVIGTAGDPQGFDAQCNKLLAANMIVTVSNIRAARLAARAIADVATRALANPEGRQP